MAGASDPSAQGGASETRADRRERYEAVMRTVDHQTSPTQPPGVRSATVCQILSPRFEPDDVRKALRAGYEQGDLHAWRDRDGALRYTRRWPLPLVRLAEHLDRNDETTDERELERALAAIREVRDVE